jgi:putative spermidine/putrescine transport system substrate-binding protein
MVDQQPLSRRQALQLTVSAGLGLAGLSLGLGGCTARAPRPQLLASRGDLPSAWSARLPKGWQVLLRDDPAAVLEALATRADRKDRERPALLQLGDGWATRLQREALQPIGTAALLKRLDPQAEPVARLFATRAEAAALAFPWAVNPWVLVLRNRPDLARRAPEGWALLLDPSLRGRLVLPSSPRLVLSLVEEDPERLRQLRQQALAYDDRDGLSLLLQGYAEAAVLPRQRVVPLLRRDPRLAVVLPEQGGPLSWNLLLSPAGAPAAPLEWLGEALEPPLLPTLLAAGWVPPLPQTTLENALAPFPTRLRTLLLPAANVRARWRDLPPLLPAERQRLQALWDGAAPADPAS